MQKFKLINNKTKEETICSLVTIDGFDYYVSDDKIIENISVIYNNKIYSTVYSNTVPQGEILLSGFGYVMKSSCKKVIATNNPNIDIPKVIDEVEKLSFNEFPEIIKDVWTAEGLAFEEDIHEACREGFTVGYDKAKETYQFTEEDMLDFGKYCINNQLCKEENRYYQYWELLQIFKEQQIKTIFYE